LTRLSPERPQAGRKRSKNGRAGLKSNPDATIVSRSGTRHFIWPQLSELHAGRISTLCGMGLHPDEGPSESLRDCVFCQTDRELFLVLALIVVELQECGYFDAQSTVEYLNWQQPEIISKSGAHNVEEMVRLILRSEIPKLSATFAGIYREFNQTYFEARLPEYSVHVVFDLDEFANEPPIYDGGQSNGLIRFEERCIYVRDTGWRSMEETLIHEMAHAATTGDHDEEWLTEMRRLKEAGAPVPAWEVE
jgi:hypothetical protein